MSATSEYANLIRSRLTLFEPSPDAWWQNIHTTLRNNILDKLRRLKQHNGDQNIIVVRGVAGTPIDRIADVLTDLLSVGWRELPEYRTIWHLELAPLRKLVANHPDPLAAFHLIGAAMSLSAQENRLLVLNDLEELDAGTPVDENLIAALGSPGKALVVAFYRETDRGAAKRDGILSNRKMIVIPAEPDPTSSEEKLRLPARTRTTLSDHFLPHYAKAPLNVKFTENAFDSIIALEPYIWRNNRTFRLTLPYLAVYPTRDAITTVVSGGASAVINQANTALGKLAILRRYTDANPELTSYFDPLWQDIEADLKGLIADNGKRAVVESQQKKVLSRAHLIAQLLSDNSYEIYLPKTKPSKLLEYTPDKPATTGGQAPISIHADKHGVRQRP